MKTIRILFMGASNRNSLLERFQSSAEVLKINLEMFSLEDSHPWHAIAAAKLAKTIPAPLFNSPEFTDFILKVCRDSGIDIIIPMIDKATIALAKASSQLREMGVMPVVCGLEICETMADKGLSDEFFKKLGLKVPLQDKFPLLAKPRFGASSRGIVKLQNKEELDFWSKSNNIQDFILQTFIKGKEYSVDAYVDSKNRMIGCVSRIRNLVAEGEVMISSTQAHEKAIQMTEQLVREGQWYGPLTIQVIDDGKDTWIIECNPRFGGGVTLSIEAGLNMPEWILREKMGLPLPDKIINWRDGLCMTRARKDYFLWLE